MVGPLRIGIPLFNIYLNEADELSRRLSTELAEWAMELHRPVGEVPIALAHSLAGSSATVGFADLSHLARALEHGLTRSHALRHGTPDEAQLFSEVADDIRRLLHQFAAGFLKEPAPGLLERLAEHEVSSAQRLDAQSAADESQASDEEAPMIPDQRATHLHRCQRHSTSPRPIGIERSGRSRITRNRRARSSTSRSLDAVVHESLPKRPALRAPPEPTRTDANRMPSAVAPFRTRGGVRTTSTAPAISSSRTTTATSRLRPGVHRATPRRSVFGALDGPRSGFGAFDGPRSSFGSLDAQRSAFGALQARFDPLGVSELKPLVALAPDAATPGLAAESADDAEDDIDAQDAVDAELFPVFEEEALELIPRLATQLRTWVREPDEAANASACMRILHTLKGGARLAGAMRLGEMAHRLETRIERILAHPPISVEDLEALEGRCDNLAHALEALAGREGAAAANDSTEAPAAPAPSRRARAGIVRSRRHRVRWRRVSRPEPHAEQAPPRAFCRAGCTSGPGS